MMEVGHMEFTRRDTKIMKGIAICLMICHHTFTFADRLHGVGYVSLFSVFGYPFATFFGHFSRVCLYIFTLLGGYGTYVSAKKNGDLTALTGRHLVGLYTTYWKVFAICVPLYFLAGLGPAEHPVQDVIYSFLGMRFSFCEEWWFVVPYALLTITFPFMQRVIDRKNASPFADFALILLINAFIYYVLPELCELPVFAPLAASMLWDLSYATLTVLPSYLVGCVFAKYGLLSAVKRELAGRPVWVLAAIAVFGATVYIHTYNWVQYDFINAALVVVCALIVLPLRIARPAAWVLEKLGEESTYMWLLHTVLAYHLAQRLVFLPKYSILIFIWLVALCYAGAKLIRLFYAALGRIYARLFRAAAEV